MLDIADAHIRGVEYLIQGGENLALNFGAGRGYSVLEVVRMARGVSGRQIRTIDAPPRSGDPPILTADPSLAKATLSWGVGRSSLETIIGDAWSVYG